MSLITIYGPSDDSRFTLLRRNYGAWFKGQQCVVIAPDLKSVMRDDEPLTYDATYAIQGDYYIGPMDALGNERIVVGKDNKLCFIQSMSRVKLNNISYVVICNAHHYKDLYKFIEGILATHLHIDIIVEGQSMDSSEQIYNQMAYAIMNADQAIQMRVMCNKCLRLHRAMFPSKDGLKCYCRTCVKQGAV